MHRSIFRIFVNIAHHKEAQIIAVYLQTIRTENLECVATNTSDLLYMCMYVCMYVRVYLCVYVRVCMYVLMCVYGSALVYVYICCVYVCVCV
jgi:hypothetical protein